MDGTIVRQANSKQWEEFRNPVFSDFGIGSDRKRDCPLEVSISNQQFQFPKPVCLYLVVQTYGRLTGYATQQKDDFSIVNHRLTEQSHLQSRVSDDAINDVQVTFIPEKAGESQS